MISFKQLREKCWAGYHSVGMKKKNGKMVPNCVPKESVSSDDDYRAKKKALQDIQNDPKTMAVVGREKWLKRKDKLDKDYQNFKNKDKLAASYDKAIDQPIEEDAPANAVGDGSAVAMPPAHEPGVHVKKKKKTVISLLKREDYNRVELENVVNKICANQGIEENQIEPIIKNLQRKQKSDTYSEEVGVKTFRYVVDNYLGEAMTEDFKNMVAGELLKKYI